MSVFVRFVRPVALRRLAVAAAFLVVGACVVTGSAGADSGGVPPNAVGALDCNGFSPIQKTVKPSMVCTDPRSIENGRGARFEDNEHYIGHDEPSTRFLSDVPGSANNITWTETLPLDPAAPPTVANPGSDVLVPPDRLPSGERRERAAQPADLRHRRRGQLVPRGAVLSAGVRAVPGQHQLRQRPLVRVAAHQRS